MCTTWRALPHNRWRAAARARVSSSWLQEGCHAVDMLPTPVLSHVHICVSSSVTACLLSHGRYRCASAPLCRRPLVPALQAVLGRPPPAPARGQGLPRRAALPLRRRAAALFCTGSGHARHTSGQHHGGAGEGQHVDRGLQGNDGTAEMHSRSKAAALKPCTYACLGMPQCAHGVRRFLRAAPSNALSALPMPWQVIREPADAVLSAFLYHTQVCCTGVASGGSN